MFSISFLVPKRKPLVYFVFHGKGKPHVLDQMHFAHVQSEVCFPSRLLKGESLLSRHKDPGYTISYLWPCQLSAAFARASCCELCLVGTGRLCVVCSPANLLRVLQTSVPSPTGGGAAGECQAVASAIWAQPLRTGPWPFYKLPTTSVLISLSWE